MLGEINALLGGGTVFVAVLLDEPVDGLGLWGVVVEDDVVVIMLELEHAILGQGEIVPFDVVAGAVDVVGGLCLHGREAEEEAGGEGQADEAVTVFHGDPFFLEYSLRIVY